MKYKLRFKQFLFFDDKKLIIIKNWISLFDNKEAPKLIKILDNKDRAVKVIFIHEGKVSKKSSLFYKYLVKNAELIELNKVSANKIPDIISSMIKKLGGKYICY